MQSIRVPFFLALFGLMLLVQSCSNNSDNANANARQTAPTGGTEQATAQFVQQTIEPAFENLDVPMHSFNCSPAKPQTLKMESGTSISVPENAFTDKNGKPVEGQINLQFREFHNAAEIMASGIPMKVSGENGESGWMQTAGMYEIKGFCNGEPVFVAPGKALTVHLVSEVGGAYDFWKFEPEKGNWDNYGVSNATPNPAAKESIRALAELQRQIPPAPTEPVAYDKSKPALDFDINYDKFPELKNKRGIVWQYAGSDLKEDPARNEWIFNEAWENVKIEALPNQTGLYRLTLASDEKRYEIPVRPTRSEKELAAAKVDYQQQLAIYKAKVTAIEARKQAFAAEQAAFMRSFEVSGFGIYNYDILLKMQQNIPMLADFDFGGALPESLKKQAKVYLITGGRRSVVCLPPGNWEMFSFDPNADNCIVAVLPGNRLATFSQKDFEQQRADLQAAKGQRYVFKMKVDERKAESVADVQRRLLTLG